MKKLILVDNIRAAQHFERSRKKDSGIAVLTAPSNEEALRLHREENVSLIVTKLEMPRMNGDVLCSLIRRDPRLSHVSILLICAKTDVEIKRCVLCGANAYLARPFSSEELVQTAMRLLDVSPRKSFRVLIRVSAEKSRAGRPFYSTLINISTSGILIESNTHLSEGEPVVCSFYLPGRPTELTVRGHVVRVVRSPNEATQCGIQFTDVSLGDQGDIAAFVKNEDFRLSLRNGSA